MTPRSSNPDFMNGVPALLILRVLKEREMYGYEIVQALKDRAGEAMAVGEGVVYPVLHGMERDGTLTSRRRTVNGRGRIYYALTPAGSLRLAKLSKAWTRLAGVIGEILQGGAGEPILR
jgi:PadR family transcriptional regulator PadR